MMNGFFYQTKIGRMFIAEDGLGISEVTLLHDTESEAEDLTTKDREFLKTKCYDLKETPLIREAAAQLEQYFDGKRKDFSLKLNPKGTEFQKKVWEALQAIPYGETRSYRQIAEAVGNSKASRAVGMANHHNPIMCIVPCHRVIGANGSLVGYAGGLDIKAQLLTMEKQYR